MIRKKILSNLPIIVFLVIVFPLISFGQTFLDGKFLELTMTPERPEPFQTVNFVIKSFSYDLDRLKISWLVNNVEKRTEIGLTEFSMSAGPSGQKTTVKVVVEVADGSQRGIETTFIPSSVDLIYETSSYTPPFYKGKALNPSQGTVLVTALPTLIKSNGIKIPAANIIYTWKKNGQAQKSASGYGKNTFAFSGEIPIRDSLIEVTASSLEGDVSATKFINIPNVATEIIFYENNPIYGLMTNKGIRNTVKMVADEFSTVAIPYFFSVNSVISPDLEYVWSLDGRTVESQDPKNSFTTRVEKAGAGVAEIGLKITNLTKILQTANNSYTLNFEKQ